MDFPEKKRTPGIEQKREHLASGEWVGREPYVEKSAEAREFPQHEQAIQEALEREISRMKQDETLRQEAEDKVKKIHVLGDDDKLKNLLSIAKTKGVAMAVAVARDMNDPYLLDTLHDLLAKEGYYKDFVK